MYAHVHVNFYTHTHEYKHVFVCIHINIKAELTGMPSRIALLHAQMCYAYVNMCTYTSLTAMYTYACQHTCICVNTHMKAVLKRTPRPTVARIAAMRI